MLLTDQNLIHDALVRQKLITYSYYGIAFNCMTKYLTLELNIYIIRVPCNA